MPTLSDERIKQIFRACRDCSICAGCETELEPTEPIWRRWFVFDNGKRPCRAIVPLCCSCRQQSICIPTNKIPALMRAREDETLEIFDYFLFDHPCENCSRPVTNPDDSVHRKHTSCCWDCSQKIYSRGRRKTPELADCGQCGESFQVTRSDAVYCSNRCRQKAHRGKIRNVRSAF